MLPGPVNLTRMSASGGMKSGIELVVRVLVGGAAIRPSVAAPPPRVLCQISALTISSSGSGWPALWSNRPVRAGLPSQARQFGDTGLTLTEFTGRPTDSVDLEAFRRAGGRRWTRR
jgi:hypothetical protein